MTVPDPIVLETEASGAVIVALSNRNGDEVKHPPSTCTAM